MGRGWSDREPSLPEEYIPEIQEKLKTVGIKWSDFKVTDNTCKPHPLPENPLIAVSPFGHLRHSKERDWMIPATLTSFVAAMAISKLLY